MSLWKSEQDCVNRMVVSASLTANNLTFTSHISTPVHNGNTVDFCKGATINAAGTAGYLAVHLVDDPAGTWYLLYLVPGAVMQYISFDLIGDSTLGTTVTLDSKVTVYPAMYKTASNV
jgi:hypothetical protein